MTRCS